MADMEQEVFDAGATEAPSPDFAPSSPQPSVSPQTSQPDSRAISDAIDAIRGPVPNYGTQPQAPQPPPAPPNPDDEPVKSGMLRDLLNERAARQRYEAQVRDFQAREQERQRQQTAPKVEDLIFQDPAAYDRLIEQKIEQKTAHIRLESDMQMASMRHGQMFDAAWQHFFQSCQNGADPVSYFRVMNARSPGEEMVRWFNERRIMHETGGDLNAFRNRVAQQLLQDPEFLAYMQQNGGSMPPPERQQSRQQHAGQMQPRGEDGRFQPQQQPRHEVRLPTSLNRMNGASRGVSFDGPEDGSEEAIFDAGRPRSKQ
jgi:hypothetical protein